MFTLVNSQRNANSNNSKILNLHDYEKLES